MPIELEFCMPVVFQLMLLPSRVNSGLTGSAALLGLMAGMYTPTLLPAPGDRR